MSNLPAPVRSSQSQLTKIRNAANYSDRLDRAREAAELRDGIFAAMESIMNNPAGKDGDLSASQTRDYDKLETVFDELQQIHDENFVNRRGVVAPTGPDPKAYADGQPLTAGQTFNAYAQARGHIAEGLEDGEDLNFAKYMRGMTTGQWKNADTERRVFNSMSGASSTAGGALLPTPLSTQLIDLARNKTQVMRAGATTVPMDKRVLDVPRWTTDPSPAWRAENAALAISDGAVDKITLTAQSLAVVTKVSRELVEDAENFIGELEAAFAAKFALELDRVALYGAGASNEPTGVKTNANVTKTPLATNGASPTWDNLVDSVGRLRDQNEEPTAQITADRTLRSLAKLKGSDGQYMRPPTYLDGIERLDTNQVPINQTVGTSTDTADVFTADWRQLLIGIHIDLRIEVLKERFLADNGQIGFIGWFRGDIQVARPKAFDVVTGVRP